VATLPKGSLMSVGHSCSLKVLFGAAPSSEIQGSRRDCPVQFTSRVEKGHAETFVIGPAPEIEFDL